jgi:hypothetical protein
LITKSPFRGIEGKGLGGKRREGAIAYDAYDAYDDAF